MNLPAKRLLVVSNRLPLEITKDKAEWKVKPSPGGLVTALAPLMRRSGGLWIGWPGCPDTAPAARLLDALPNREFEMKPVGLTLGQVDKYYRGYANKTIWPLFHDLLGHFSFQTEDWQEYRTVNKIFAEAIAASDPDQSFVWIHDYQLLFVGASLRNMGIELPLSFFLHIPFPSPDMLRRLPYYTELLEAMLKYDHIGFQTAQDKNNFVQCVKAYIPNSRRLNYKRQAVIKHGGRKTKVGNYPISIDFEEFSEGALHKDVEDASWYLKENVRAEKLVLGMDRLDYTKGIPERFLAFERFLEKYEEVRGKVSLLQVVVPSRLNVSDYQELKSELDSFAGRINSRFSRHGWIPIHYQFRSLDRIQLLGHYKACEIALITPLRDGMNLVSKEYCASSVDNKGVLILSEFAGSARQLRKGALLVNPYDADSTADALYTAFTMPVDEQQKRMRILRAEVKKENVQRWIGWFLGDEKLAEQPEEVTVV